jgi:epoxide hydrolase-like predicted phosphatase
MVKAIVFDYFGVIVEDSVVSKWIKKNFSDPESRIKAVVESSIKWDLGETGYSEFNKILSRYTGIPANQIFSTFFENIKMHQGTIELIKLLKNNYKIILLSNAPKENLQKMLKNQNIENLFNEIVISAEHKIMKPDPKIYELMLSIGGINASEAIFIDDRQVNVDAAANLGIKSFLFTDATTLKNDLTSMGIKLE